jgi:uncharacterized protein (DUF1684 family)
MNFRPISLLPLMVFLLNACRQEPEFSPLSPADSAMIVARNLEFRSAREEFFRSDPESPFRQDSTAIFTGIRWYPVDPMFRGRSVLHRYENPQSVDVVGTGGETRRQLRYGYFEFTVPDSAGKPVMIRLHAYKEAGASDPRFTNFLSVWFTDETTGVETYGVGRYVDIERERNDDNHEYIIDLNMAYNPFCAYSDLYSCAIPTKDDHIPVHIRAGEQMYH